MIDEQLRQKANQLGLQRLRDEHLAQLGRALDTIARHLQRLPRDLPPAQEPALTFTAKGPAR
jgi:hypothetical protein